jgi:hypothetical protein
LANQYGVTRMLLGVDQAIRPDQFRGWFAKKYVQLDELGPGRAAGHMKQAR